jgi:hypothetical protein
MTRSSSFFFVILLTINTIHAQRSVTLAEAIAQKMIAVSAISEGGHHGQSLSILIDRLNKNSFEIMVPAGMLFHPADPSLQSLINVHEEKILVDGAKKKKRIYGRCTEANDGSPGSGNAYTLGAMASDSLVRIAQYISNNQLFDAYQAQYAIWALTNDYPIATVGHTGLLTLTCQVLGVPIPDYEIVQDAPVYTPGAPAYHFTPMRVEGKFAYQDTAAHTLQVVLRDSSGADVRTIIPDRPYAAKSKTRFTYHFETERLPYGKYQVCLLSDQTTVRCIAVDYGR